MPAQMARHHPGNGHGCEGTHGWARVGDGQQTRRLHRRCPVAPKLLHGRIHNTLINSDTATQYNTTTCSSTGHKTTVYMWAWTPSMGGVGMIGREREERERERDRPRRWAKAPGEAGRWGTPEPSSGHISSRDARWNPKRVAGTKEEAYLADAQQDSDDDQWDDAVVGHGGCHQGEHPRGENGQTQQPGRPDDGSHDPAQNLRRYETVEEGAQDHTLLFGIPIKFHLNEWTHQLMAHFWSFHGASREWSVNRRVTRGWLTCGGRMVWDGDEWLVVMATMAQLRLTRRLAAWNSPKKDIRART